MITLSASGGSVTFTFDGNSTYLNDGQITVPVNSLALIIDESDMATFRKAASNDIFVSANIVEFGMTKAELESWYKANMVGSTSGGGGVTSGEVQTMIDESISGKADTSYVDQSISGKANSSDVYTTGQTSGATEIANALSAKLDATAYTVDVSVNSASTNPVQNQTLYGELRVGGGTSKVEIDFNTGGYVPEGVTQLEVNPTTTDTWAYYNFYNGSTNLGNYRFTNWNSFEVDNNLEGSSYVISGETVIITYPASLGVTRIAKDSGNSDWAFEAVIETPAVPLKDVVSGKADSSAVAEEISAAVSGKMDTSAYTVDTSVNSASTNPVQNQALYYVLSYIYSQLPYLSVIENGDFEGSGNTNFLYKPSGGNAQYCTIQDGIGKDNSRGIVVTNTTAGQQFDTELFVKMNQIIKLGTKFHIEFDYKANKTINGVSTQSHGNPTEYHYWDCIGSINFTDQWQHFSKTLTVSSDMAGTNNDFQTICFTLGATADAEYYFDNFVITVEQKL